MGFRFRKSISLFPGIKLNIGTKSAGISIGGKHGGVSFNTKTGTRVRASIPGTGISYTQKITGTPHKCATQKQPPAHSPEFYEANNYIRILRESALICADTVDPETFFPRYDLMVEMVDKLLKLKGNVSLEGASWEDIATVFENHGNEEIICFINKYFDVQSKSANELKTERGKSNRMKKALEILMQYEDHFDPTCKNLISELWKDHNAQSIISQK